MNDSPFAVRASALWLSCICTLVSAGSHLSFFNTLVNFGQIRQEETRSVSTNEMQSEGLGGRKRCRFANCVKEELCPYVLWCWWTPKVLLIGSLWLCLAVSSVLLNFPVCFQDCFVEWIALTFSSWVNTYFIFIFYWLKDINTLR